MPAVDIRASGNGVGAIRYVQDAPERGGCRHRPGIGPGYRGLVRLSEDDTIPHHFRHSDLVPAVPLERRPIDGGQQHVRVQLPFHSGDDAAFMACVRPRDRHQSVPEPMRDGRYRGSRRRCLRSGTTGDALCGCSRRKVFEGSRMALGRRLGIVEGLAAFR